MSAFVEVLPRVIDVTQWYAPTSGGIRTYLRAKADWAARSGAPHAAVVTGEHTGQEQVAQSSFVTVRGRTPNQRWGYRLAVRSPAVIEALESLRPDVVVLHDALAFPRAIAEWAAAHGVAVVMLCHSHLSAAAAGLPRAIRRPAATLLGCAQRRALAAVSMVMVASHDTKRRVAGHTSGPIIVTPLGVDLAHFQAAAPDREIRRTLVADESPLLLYAGRLSSEKRVDLLPPMLAQMGGGAVLAIAGHGAARASLERRARRHGVADRIVLLGHVGDRERLATLMATADCFVHPNPDEPSGLTPLEALAAGCRVVAPRSGGLGEFLGHHGALLVDPDSATALAEGVRQALAEARPMCPPRDDLGWDRTFAREWDVYRRLRATAT